MRPSARIRKKSSPSLRPLLTGGDRRSVARSERVHQLVIRSPERIAELALLARDSDWLVSLRAMDLLEKLAHEHAAWVEPYKELFIGPLADSEKWELRLQVVRALPLFEWSARDRRRAVRILRRDIEHPQKFVRAWALDSLATFAGRDTSLRRTVLNAVRDFETSGSKALESRARRIRERLASDATS